MSLFWNEGRILIIFPLKIITIGILFLCREKTYSMYEMRLTPYEKTYFIFVVEGVL